MDTTKEHINHLSLCSGYEGIGLGLRRVLPTLREIAYVEREGFPIANLVAKMESGKLDPAPIYTDVKTFPYGEFRGCVDILSGGFPCQPFSNAGVRKGVEDPRHLFPYIAEGIRQCQPTVVFLENVEGIISAKTADGESVLKYVLRTLEGLGYRATAGVFSASEVGAPHQRKRVFILGYSEHDGSHASTISRGSTETVRDEPQGSDCTIQSKGASAPTELADSHIEGLEGYELHGSAEQGEPIQANTWAEGCTRWPSRPGEPQYDWEEPRVTELVHAESQQGSSDNHRGESGSPSESEQVQPRGGDRRSLRTSHGQAQSGLGRATHGSSSRVDRLRLLGNGVVPATAAKAFLTLTQRLNG